MPTWDPTDRGFRSDRYEIELAEPGRWVLSVGGRHHSTHRGARAAALAAARLERSRRSRRSLVRWGVFLAAAVLAMAVIAPFRVGRDPDYPAGREFAAPLEQAYRAVVAGEAEPEDFTTASHGFAGGRFTIELPPPAPGDEPVVREYRALVAERESPCAGVFAAAHPICSCHVLRWQERGGSVLTGALPPTVACDPTALVLAAETAYDRYAVVGGSTGRVSWEGVLPSEHRQAPWFLPAIVVLIAVALFAFAGAGAAVIRARGGDDAAVDPLLPARRAGDDGVSAGPTR